MGIFSRLSDIINSNIVHMLDKAENPEKMVRLIIQEMEDTLVEVKSNAARFIADKKTLERHLSEVKEGQAKWLNMAELAVLKNRDDLAKSALEEKAKKA
ncbi:MAG: PspA/IM30 family protein, partial [Deltaproteobacteria bacterium]|nr:PspA/IM30 family protein [Deltaproteobacteria bacterium]